MESIWQSLLSVSLLGWATLVGSFLLGLIVGKTTGRVRCG